MKSKNIKSPKAKPTVRLCAACQKRPFVLKLVNALHADIPGGPQMNLPFPLIPTFKRKARLHLCHLCIGKAVVDLIMQNSTITFSLPLSTTVKMIAVNEESVSLGMLSDMPIEDFEVIQVIQKALEEPVPVAVDDVDLTTISHEDLLVLESTVKIS